MTRYRSIVCALALSTVAGSCSSNLGNDPARSSPNDTESSSGSTEDSDSISGTSKDTSVTSGDDTGTDSAFATETEQSTDESIDTLTSLETNTNLTTESTSQEESDSFVEDSEIYLIEKVVECHPTADVCSLSITQNGVRAGYRKDYYLPNSAYPEDNDPPLVGGRLHIAGIAATGGTVTQVLIDGVDVESIFSPNPSSTPIAEWTHVWPRQLVAGRPLWVAFHSRLPIWDTRDTGSGKGRLTVLTDQGAALDADFDVEQTKIPLTYVTTVDGYTNFVIHVKNTDLVSHTVSKLWLNGVDVTDAACLPDKTIAPGVEALWTVPLCEPTQPGAAFTVVVEYGDAAPAVGVGRVLREQYILEAWNNTNQCPFPGGNEENYGILKSGGLDTMYFHDGVCSADQCNCDVETLLSTTLPAEGDWYALVASDTLINRTLPNTAAIVGALTGDESDGSIYDDTTGVPVAAGKARKSDQLWEKYPEVATYNGGKTNKNVGTFAGMADVQGMDFYVAACAPHITSFGSYPPLRGAYDYLVNTRNNHMPLPTWLYSQGLATAWNQEYEIPIIGGTRTVHVQPAPQEILIQGLSVAAAGAKGLMWFQVNQGEIEHSQARWDAIAKVNWIFRGIRDELREGDISGMVTGPDEVLVESIRARDAIVLVVISLNFDASKAPNDISCEATSLLDESLVPHYVIRSHTPDVSAIVPDDFGVVEVFEVVDRQTPSLSENISISGRSLTIESLALSNAQPVRVIVLAGRSGLRQEMLDRM